MYLLYRLTQNDMDVERVENQLNDFKIKYSFKAVSNELMYQNLYNKMLDVLDISSLIADVEDASERIKSADRESDEKREKTTNRILFILGLLSIGSALIDFSDYIDKLWPINEIQISTYVSLGIVVVATIITLLVGRPVMKEIKDSFVNYIKGKKKKHGDRQNLH